MKERIVINRFRYWVFLILRWSATSVSKITERRYSKEPFGSDTLGVGHYLKLEQYTFELLSLVGFSLNVRVNVLVVTQHHVDVTMNSMSETVTEIYGWTKRDHLRDAVLKTLKTYREYSNEHKSSDKNV